MEQWKINLVVLWVGCFLVFVGMSMIIPFLPLFIQEMGIHDPNEISIWAGAIFAANFVTSFIFQPIWGKYADRLGNKIMVLRSGFGMALVTLLMGFSGNVWHLLFLRTLNGVISGFNPASIALVSAGTPRSKIGFAMGALQSGAVAGTILGPFFGGIMAEWVGYRPIFFITGSLLFLATLIAMLVVREPSENRQTSVEKNASIWEGLQELIKFRQIPALFSITFFIQFSIVCSMPQLPLLIQHMPGTAGLVAFYAGLVGSITGFSNMLASPLLGKLGDRFGHQRILILSLAGAGIAFIPQALSNHVWQFLASRFLLGIFIGGLLPSVNALIRKYTPDGMESRAYSFNTSALSLGNLLGSLTGGLLAAWIGIRGIFVLSSVLLTLNALWVRKTLFAKRKQSTS